MSFFITNTLEYTSDGYISIPTFSLYLSDVKDGEHNIPLEELAEALKPFLKETE